MRNASGPSPTASNARVVVRLHHRRKTVRRICAGSIARTDAVREAGPRFVRPAHAEKKQVIAHTSLHDLVAVTPVAAAQSEAVAADARARAALQGSEARARRSTAARAPAPGQAPSRSRRLRPCRRRSPARHPRPPGAVCSARNSASPFARRRRAPVVPATESRSPPACFNLEISATWGRVRDAHSDRFSPITIALVRFSRCT
jgi:hypothetical protein